MSAGPGMLRKRPLSSPSRGSQIPTVPPPKRHPYDQWSPDARALDLVGDKWTLLIIRDLAAGPRRFVELQRVLPGISTEQLRSRLNRMVADGLLTRQRYREVPPRVDYELTERSRELMPVVGALARWGYEWTWSPPRSAESVDVTAIFRLATGLIAPGSASGTAELIVRDSGADELRYTITVDEHRAVVREAAAAGADTEVAGDTAAWIAALSPQPDRDGLQISGSRELAERVLDGLAARPSQQQNAHVAAA
jgi:DNA-binding HxlR family transcriptional regulator